MTKGTVAIREVKCVENTANVIEDYSYRLIGKRIATEYLKRKDKEESESQHKWFYAGYFFLGCLFFASIPAISEIILYIKGLF